MIGSHYDNVTGTFSGEDIEELGQRALYHFSVIPIVRYIDLSRSMLPFKKENLFITGPDSYLDRTVAKFSTYDITGEKSVIMLQAFKKELSWASHLSFKAVLLNLTDITQSSRLVSDTLISLTNSQVWVTITLQKNNEENAWLEWSRLRHFCSRNSNLYVALEITTKEINPVFVQQWIGEPVKAVILPKCVWLRNKLDYPVLSKSLQNMMNKFKQLDPHYIVQSDEEPSEAYSNYLAHCINKLSERTIIEEAAIGYEDFLQLPLQPLMDNLESDTYETFMKDPVKYQLYEDAIAFALQQRVEEDLKLQITNDKKDWKCHLFVVGAGSKGPLVDCAIRAAYRTGTHKKLCIYALEKNKNAMVTLTEQNNENSLWMHYPSEINVIYGDMRNTVYPSQKADFLVSELLGSFGDNELSPECLDGAQRFMKSSDPFNRKILSIPSNYTAFLAPIASEKLKSEVINLNMRHVGKGNGSKKAFETPYVVHFSKVRELKEALPVWKFEHPLRIEVDSDIKSLSLADDLNLFKSNNHNSSMLDGFGGYFESELFSSKDNVVLMSNNPKTHTPDMFSWFSLYFPLETSVQIYENDTVSVNLWRCVDDESLRVWYEWSCEVFDEQNRCRYTSHIHNFGGRSYFIGL